LHRLATVRVRVTAAAVGVVAAALAAGGTWLVLAHRATLTNNTETAAQLRALDVAAALRNSALPASVETPPGDETIVQVVDSEGRVVSSSANVAGAPPFSRLDPGPAGHLSTTADNLPVADGPFRVVADRVPTAGGVFTVYVAATLEGVRESTDDLVRRLLLGLPLLLAVVGVTTWVVAGRALRPVEDIRREVEAISAHALDRRVPEPRTTDEVGRLARTMNAMLGRLEDAHTRQRQFIADASHELRSPLAGMRARLEVDLAHPETVDWTATEAELLEDAIRLQRLVDDLLVLARSDGALAPSSPIPVDLDEIVLSEARQLRARTAIAVDTSAVSGAQVFGVPDDLARAVRNLIDNAARHARSKVTIALSESDSAVVLTVTDDGSGIPPGVGDRIFERFTRLDDARVRDAGGAGLGLAIVHEVVTAHGGAIAVENTPGARFSVRLPTEARRSPR
jgi:signal transduction histidine kinase